MAGNRYSCKRKTLVLALFGLFSIVTFFYTPYKVTLIRNEILHTTPVTLKRKAFIHVGIPKTGTTTIQNAIYRDRTLLASDGFNYAVHGLNKKNNLQNGNNHLNIDRLGNCLWTKEATQMAIKEIGSSKVVGECPPSLLPKFKDLLNRTKTQNRNIVVSNEWLNRNSSEYGLNVLFGSDWKVIIVIYYRKYYDWIISQHFQIRDIQYAIQPTQDDYPKGLRMIDYFRRNYKSILNYTGDMISYIARMNFGEKNYAYSVIKRYESIPRFKDNIVLVNMNQGDPVKNLYCEVMQAKHTCASISIEEKQLKMRAKDSASLVYEDLVLGAFQNGSIQRKLPPNRFMDEVKKWTNLVGANIISLVGGGNNTVYDLPFECLSHEEHERLLKLSETYEQLLAPYMLPLPNKMDSSINHNNTICSVMVDQVLLRPEWKDFFKKHST